MKKDKILTRLKKIHPQRLLSMFLTKGLQEQIGIKKGTIKSGNYRMEYDEKTIKIFKYG